MTAPNFHFADDPDGRPTIWHGDRPVADRDGDRIRIDMQYADVVWPLLTAVLAPDEATVERLARAGAEAEGFTWDLTMPEARDSFVANVRAVLAALGAPEQTGPDGGQGEAVRAG